MHHAIISVGHAYHSDRLLHGAIHLLFDHHEEAIMGYFENQV